jgi:hypothetical protein
MSDLEKAFGDHFAMQEAIEAAWRRAKRSKKPLLPLNEIIGWVLERCPTADRTYLRKEFGRRFSRWRPRARS